MLEKKRKFSIKNSFDLEISLQGQIEFLHKISHWILKNIYWKQFSIQTFRKQLLQRIFSSCRKLSRSPNSQIPVWISSCLQSALITFEKLICRSSPSSVFPLTSFKGHRFLSLWLMRSSRPIGPPLSQRPSS